MGFGDMPKNYENKYFLRQAFNTMKNCYRNSIYIPTSMLYKIRKDK
jgi:hypothetical protein